MYPIIEPIPDCNILIQLVNWSFNLCISIFNIYLFLFACLAQTSSCFLGASLHYQIFINTQINFWLNRPRKTSPPVGQGSDERLFGLQVLPGPVQLFSQHGLQLRSSGALRCSACGHFDEGRWLYTITQPGTYFMICSKVF